MTRRALLLSLLPACLLPALPAAQKPAGDVVLGRCLVLAPVGRYGRAPLHTDALEAEIVAGRWKAPRAGDAVKYPGGTRTWEAASAKDGTLEHPSLRGGYLYWKVAADAPRVTLLEAAGHLAVYVNGEPRAGDPYGYGTLRLPVVLHAGDNDLLFHVGRGRLSARLATPVGPALLDTRDVTTPDLLPDAPPPWAALVVTNATDKVLQGLSLRAAADGAESVITPVPPVPPLGTRKVGLRVPNPPGTGDATVRVSLGGDQDGRPGVLDTATLTVRRRRADEAHKRTFVSSIDGSVQYYAVRPARPGPGDGRPGLVLSLHGAAVEAMRQAECYEAKTWAHVVAPTNRRPYGFDWEEWGRLDALEVLALARKEFDTPPRRTWLTGHSMGGHGTWHLGLTFPDHFAAIAPSAGWVSFSTYAGGARPANPGPADAMLLRAASPSDTFALVSNCAPQGVYVLHGDLDDNVPVGQARMMRERLGRFHADFAYYERPGAGHWWGNECMDWPPLMDFLSRHTLPRPADVSRVEFTTASPGVSSRCHWLVIHSQTHALQPSTGRLRCNREKRRFDGTTDNIERLTLDLSVLPPGKPVAVDLDGQSLGEVPWPAGAAELHLRREAGKWSVAGPPAASLKGPHRYGPFKEAFRDRFVLVYGTKGTPEENAWALAKARLDAESFRYRGNGSPDVVADVAFDPDKERDRGVAIYGNADTNAAWPALLPQCPVRLGRGEVQVGGRKQPGEDLACLFVRPRPGSDRALVAVVGGTGLAGMRLTDRLPYFISGVAYPDCVVLGTEVLTRGSEGVRAAGFFGNDWAVESGEWAWAKVP
jgi:hypothetical protein